MALHAPFAVTSDRGCVLLKWQALGPEPQIGAVGRELHNVGSVPYRKRG